LTLLLLLLNLAGAIALLLCATLVVRTGFERARGNTLRKWVRRAGSGQIRAAATGTIAAMLMQSSTAVALLATGFVASATLEPAAGLAILLGADMGSALVVSVLSLDLSWLLPLLLVCGVFFFMKSHAPILRQTGQILIGIALILISLQLLTQATLPLRESKATAIIAGFLQRDLLTAYLVGAIVTWALHSSVASVLLIMTLCAQLVFTLPVSLAMVLGANLGGGLIAFGLTRDQPANARSITLGNLLFRASLSIILLIVLRTAGLPLVELLPRSTAVVGTHLFFNLLLVALCLPLTPLVARLAATALPGANDNQPRGNPLLERNSALDREVLKTPSLALASATRECLRMADLIELMLAPVMSYYDKPDGREIEETRKLDEHVNQIHDDIKLYLADLPDTSLSTPELSRKAALANFVVNMEAAGDVIVKQLLDLAKKKQVSDLSFSPEGREELINLHSAVTANMHLALNVIVSGDINTARSLFEEKGRIREQERLSNMQHMRRLQAGTSESRETSNLHLETLRALRQINSMFAGVAYPILNQHGELRSSRLRASGNPGN